MAATRPQTPAPASGDESLPYGSARGLLDGINAALTRRDPKEQKALAKNSSAGRHRQNVLRAVSRRALLKELLRRESEEQKRIDGRERKTRWRMRQSLKKAVAKAKEQTSLK